MKKGNEEEKKQTKITNTSTNLEVLSGVGTPALLSLLSRVDGLDGIEHQVLQLQRFNQVCVPHNS